MGGSGGTAGAAQLAGRGAEAGWCIALGLLAWCAGVAAQLQQPRTLSEGAALALGLLAVLVGSGAWAARQWGPLPPAAGLLAGLVALALAGFALTDHRASMRLADRLDPALESVELTLTGVVAEMPRLSPTGTLFVFEVESASLGGTAVRAPQRVSLGWFQGFDGEQLVARPPQPVVAGERWRLNVRLKQPHGSRNPHGFDLELWLFERGIGASGVVRPGAQRLGATWRVPFERARQSIRDDILLRVPDPALAGVLAALAVGDQAAIEREDWELFRVTGVAHLMSISGLHVTMFAWAAAGLLGRLWRVHPLLPLKWPAPAFARWAGLAAATAYALLAGWGVPAQRTVLMLAVVVLLRSLALRWPQLLVLGCAGAAVSLSDPWALLQPGFWLSFVAVGVLVASDPVVRARPAAPGWRATLLEAGRSQLVATVGLAPLTVVFFQQVSIVGLMANALAIPLVTLVVTPLALAGVLAPVLWTPAAWAVQGLVWALQPLAALPFAQWSAAAAPAWAVLLGLGAGFLAVMPLPWRLRLLAVPLAWPLLDPPLSRPPPGHFEVLAADIGQGTSFLVRTHSHLLVYDTGPRSAASDAGERVLVPLLRARGETHVDLLVLSHQDSDHVGGALSLLRAGPVHASRSSLPPSHPLHARLPGHQRCEAGQHWHWDGVRFQVLHPQPHHYTLGWRPNALSCVLRVTDARGRSLLLTGDLEAAQELELVARLAHDPDTLRAEVLQAPHHGSRTSSTRELLQAVAPQRAIVQAGYRNRYGHPAPAVRARYAAHGIELVRSDACGAWGWSGEGPGWCERAVRRRYWAHRHPEGP